MPAMPALQEDEDFASDANPLASYLRDLRDIPLLTPDEEQDRGRKIRKLETVAWTAALADKSLRKRVLEIAVEALHLDPDDRFRTSQAPALLREADRDKIAMRAVIARFDHLSGTPFYKALLAAHEAAGREIQAFASANLRLVISIAKRYKNHHLSKLDLIQEGNVGLLHAIDRFDPESGFRFTTYASWWIRSIIHRALSDKSRLVRAPVHIIDKRFAVKKAERNLRAKLGRDPTDAELAAEARVDPHKLHLLLAIQDHVTSIDAPRGTGGGDEDGSPLGECLPDLRPTVEEDLCREDDRTVALRQAMASLTPREREVLRLRFFADAGEGMTLKDAGGLIERTGERIGTVCRERVRQIESKALRKLKKGIEIALRERT